MARETAEVKQAVAAVVAGKSRQDAAKQHGVTESAIWRYMKRHKIATPGQRKGPRKVYPPLPEPPYFGDGTPLLPTP